MLNYEPIPVDLTDEQARDLIYKIGAEHNIGDLVRKAVTGERMSEAEARNWVVVRQLLARTSHIAGSKEEL